MRKLVDNPWVVLIGLVASIITIFVFVTNYNHVNDVLGKGTTNSGPVISITQVVQPITQVVQPVPQGLGEPVTSGPISPQDTELFVRNYFNLLTHDRNYQFAWSLLTDGFKQKNSPDGYSYYVKFWDQIDSVSINSIQFYENTGSSAKCSVNITFYSKGGNSETNNLRYHLIYDDSRQTWMFESP